MRHAKIPMPTIDEQQGLKRANVKSDERFWSTLHDMHASTTDDHKGLAATVAHAIARGQAGMTEAADKRDAAKDKRERLERAGRFIQSARHPRGFREGAGQDWRPWLRAPLP
jgi:hypothetical protein